MIVQLLQQPDIEAGGAEAMLPSQFRDRDAGVGLPDEPDDLFRGKTILLHVRFLGDVLCSFTWCGSVMAGHARPTSTHS